MAKRYYIHIWKHDAHHDAEVHVWEGPIVGLGATAERAESWRRMKGIPWRVAVHPSSWNVRRRFRTWQRNPGPGT